MHAVDTKQELFRCNAVCSVGLAVEIHLHYHILGEPEHICNVNQQCTNIKTALPASTFLAGIPLRIPAAYVTLKARLAQRL